MQVDVNLFLLRANADWRRMGRCPLAAIHHLATHVCLGRAAGRGPVRSFPFVALNLVFQSPHVYIVFFRIRLLPLPMTDTMQNLPTMRRTSATRTARRSSFRGFLRRPRLRRLLSSSITSRPLRT
jgi:hypothetical protein